MCVCVCVCVCMCVLSHISFVQLFVTPWTVAHQAPLSMGFSRQEYWSGLPCSIYICVCVCVCTYTWTSLVAQMIKNPPAMQETLVQYLDWEDPLEKEMTTYSNILGWEIPWTEEPCGLQSSVTNSQD